MASLGDYLWLISAEAAAWMDRLEEGSHTLVQQARQLRAELSSARAHLLLELRELRRRALAKFENAPKLFFTPRGLEQSTDQWTAAHKARRFAGRGPIADLCCGIGGDLFAISAGAPATGMERDPIHALVAEANCRALGLPSGTVETRDAVEVDLRAYRAWHIDPDRRPTGRRTTRLDFSSPSLASLEQMLHRLPHAAVKVAPASELPDQWKSRAERQWIGSGRECRQQVLWFGNLAHYPGRHSAAVVHPRQEESALLVGTPDEPLDVAPSISDHVYEPHATVLAARLTGTLAHQRSLLAVHPGVAYLTSPHMLSDRLLSGFTVLDVLPFDLRRLQAALRHCGAGRLEVKKRGVAIDPDEVRRKIKTCGDQPTTVLLTPYRGSVHALVCRRHEQGLSDPLDHSTTSCPSLAGPTVREF